MIKTNAGIVFLWGGALFKTNLTVKVEILLVFTTADPREDN